MYDVIIKENGTIIKQQIDYLQELIVILEQYKNKPIELELHKIRKLERKK